MASFRCKMADVIARVKYASNKSVQEIEFQYGRKSCNFMPTDGLSNNNRACSHTGPGLHFPLSFVLHLDFWLVNSNLFWNKLILSNSQRKTAYKAEKVSLMRLHKVCSANMFCFTFSPYKVHSKFSLTRPHKMHNEPPTLRLQHTDTPKEAAPLEMTVYSKLLIEIQCYSSLARNEYVCGLSGNGPFWARFGVSASPQHFYLPVCSHPQHCMTTLAASCCP